MIDIISWIGAIIFLYISHIVQYQRLKSVTKTKPGQLHNIPGPIAIKFFGTTWTSLFGNYEMSKLHERYKEMYRQYGPIVREEAIGNIPVIHIFEKDDIVKVLKSSGKYPIRPPTEAIAQYRRSHPERYASTGLTNEQGETWYYLRHTLTKKLISPITMDQFIYEMESIADDWINLIRHNRNVACKVENLNELVERLGLEAICALVLGRRMGFLALNEENETAKRLAAAVHQNFIAARDTYFGLPLWKIFPTKAYRSLAESEKAIYELATELIETADKDARESAVFQSVLEANIDEKEKKSAIVDFLAAGIHTLKNSLLFLLYEIADHPECQQKIWKEPASTYTKACLFETFRLLPTAFALARVTNKPLILSNYHVPAGTVVLCQTGVACHNENYFEKAQEFIPERWLNDDQCISLFSILSTPFGYGKRICPGKRYIETVLPIILQRIVQNLELSTYGEPMELDFEFLLVPKGNVNICFKDRH